VAKLAGAPVAKTAGLECLVKLGEKVQRDSVLYRVHAETKGELDYTLGFIRSQPDIISITNP
jgi:thymidine phosphorylase